MKDEMNLLIKSLELEKNFCKGDWKIIAKVLLRLNNDIKELIIKRLKEEEE
jgi:hypothetical protein